MRHTHLTTQQAIDILIKDGSIYWTDEGYSNAQNIDWNAISVLFNTEEIHTFGQAMVTRLYLDREIMIGLGWI